MEKYVVKIAHVFDIFLNFTVFTSCSVVLTDVRVKTNDERPKNKHSQ